MERLDTVGLRDAEAQELRGKEMRELLKTRTFKVGYELRYEYLSGEEAGFDPDTENDKGFTMVSAFTTDGHYIGNSKFAYRIFRRGIKPELINPDHNVCSIGFHALDQKWFGWSHRALYGFGVGDVVEEDDLTASSGWTDEWLAEHPEDNTSLPVGFKAETLEDAKRMAVAFAEAIS